MIYLGIGRIDESKALIAVTSQRDKKRKKMG